MAAVVGLGLTLLGIPAFAGNSTRSGPAQYSASETLTLTNTFSPLATEQGPNTLVEYLPSGWNVGGISHGGTYIASEGMIRWIFFDNLVRELTWQIQAPSSPGPEIAFSGIASFGVPGSSVSQPVSGLGSATRRPPPSGTVTRILPSSYRPSQALTVVVSMVAEDGVTLQVAEEIPPVGWTVSSINQGGSLQSGTIRWGPFTDGAARALSYSLTPSAGASRTVAFSGTGQFGSTSVATMGSTSLSRGPDPSGTLVRTLPSTYRAGVAFTVTLVATPDSGIASYGVVETLPTGWTALGMSHFGVLSTDGTQVRWGPFLDSTARTLTFQAVPPSGASGTATFSGAGDFAGTSVTATGTTQVAFIPPATGTTTRDLPASTHPGRTFPVTIAVTPDSDVTEYSVVETLPAGYTVAVAADGVYNAATHTLRWGPYFDNTARQWTYQLTAPGPTVGTVAFSGTATYGVNSLALTGDTSLSVIPAPLGTAVRNLPNEFRPASPFTVQVAVVPEAGVGFHVVDDLLPAGWTASAISHSGSFDATLGRVRWGPFNDDVARTLQYTATSPAGVTGTFSFSGTAAFDGQSVTPTGDTSLLANGPPTISSLPDITAYEDGPVVISFTATDDVTLQDNLQVTTSSSNPALAPDADLVLDRNGSTYTLEIGLVPETAGDTVVSIGVDDGTYTTQTSFRLTITLTNDVPVLIAPATSGTTEDTPLNLGAFTVSDPDAGSGALLLAAAVANGTLRLNSLGGATVSSGSNGSAAFTLTGTLAQINAALAASVFTPTTQFVGSATVSFTLNDQGNSGAGGARSGSCTLNIPVSAVNDAPSFILGSDPSVLNTAGAQTFPGWVTGIQTGPSDESAQSVQFLVSVDTPSLFSVAPAISPSGILTFTPATGRQGTATVSVRLQDTGGTAQGGVDTSAIQTFLIIISSPANHPPTISAIADQTVLEEGLVSVALTVGDDQTALANLVVTATSSNQALAPDSGMVLGGSGANRTLALALAPEASGQATITIGVSDGTYRVNESFVLTVQATNDVPSLTVPPAVSTLEDTSVAIGAFSISDEDAGTAVIEAAVTVSDGTLQLATLGDCTVGSGSNGSAAFTIRGTVLQLNAALAASTFSPTTNFNGTAIVIVTVSDLGNTGSGGVRTVVGTVSVSVTAVNDIPTFTKGVDMSVLNTAGAQVRIGWATGINAGASNESSQVLQFTVSVDRPTLFSVAPAISSSGTLTFTPASGSIGTATVTVRLVDTGGTSNGGVNQSAIQTFLIVLTSPSNNPPTISAIADQTVPEDAPVTVSFTIGDTETPVSGLTLTATSSNTTLVPNSALVLGGTGASRTLTVTPTPETGGQTTVAISVSDGTYRVEETFVLTVQTSNDAPTLTVTTAVTVLEGGSATLGAFVVADNDVGAGVLEMAFVASNGTLALASVSGVTVVSGANGSGSLTIRGTVSQLNTACASSTFVPNADFYGTGLVTVTLNDLGNTGSGGAQTATGTVAITVIPVNDVPTFTKGSDQTVYNDQGARSIAGWATGIAAGPSNESSQTLQFTVTVDQPSLFSVAPAVSPTGTLTYTPTTGAVGTCIATIRLSDNGGTASGGIAQSAVQTFQIVVASRTDNPPALSILSDLQVSEDDPISVTFTVTDDLTSQANLVVSATSSNTALVPNSGLALGLSGSLRTLTVTPVAEVGGQTMITVFAGDGTYTVQKSFVLTIGAVNDTPSLAVPSAVSTLEDTAAAVGAFVVGDADVGSGELEVTFAVANGTLQLTTLGSATVTSGSNASAAFSIRGTVAQLNAALAASTFRPTADFFGNASLAVSVSDLGNAGAGGVKTATGSVAVTVNTVNDAPSFVKGADQTISNTAGAQSVAGWATAISAGPSTESSQSVQFTVTANPTTLFSVQPAVGSTGTLTYTPASGAVGTATVTVRLVDTGGTANGGVDQSAAQTFQITVAHPYRVVGRHLFYNQSRWDNNNAAANVDDDLAIATDKVALLPGGRAAAVNYSNFTRGINGIMIDFTVLPGTPTLSDFEFRTGNSSTPATWASAGVPAQLTVRRGAGIGGGDRVTVTWASGSIKTKWLQVTTKATAATGLLRNDVFYYGSSVGEMFNSTTDTRVNSIDFSLVRVNLTNSASISSRFDCTRDRFVNSTDFNAVRLNLTVGANFLQLISAPSAAPVGAVRLED
jgi:hypothetical protein